jgi:beta-glucanase (GH16 family)
MKKKSIFICKKQNRILLLFFLLVSYGLSGQNNNYHLVWSDEFTTDGKPNSKYWTKEVMGSPPNNELEYYVDSLKNGFAKSGFLYLRALKEKKGTKNYTSSRLITRNKIDWTYGKIEVSAKLPKGFGTWPAIWMLYTDEVYGPWPGSGEIDIMEHVGKEEGWVHGSAHGDYYNFLTGHSTKTSSYYVKDACTAFHNYICEWNTDTVKIYVDNIKIFSFGNEHKGWQRWPYDHNFFLILNIAIGGDWGGTVDNAIFVNDSSVQMVVDYVRLYKKLNEFTVTGPKTVQENSNAYFSVPYYPGYYYHWVLPSDAVAQSKTDSSVVTLYWGCKADSISIIIGKDGDTSTLQYPVLLNPLKVNGRKWVDTNAVGIKYFADSLPGATFKWRTSEGVSIKGPDSVRNILVDFASEGKIIVEIKTACNIYPDTMNVRFGNGHFPYPDSAKPMIIPGNIVAVNFDNGGEDYAYHDVDVAHKGVVYRSSESVDIESNDGGYTIGWFDNGEWVRYTVEVTDSENYKASIRVASVGGGSFSIFMDDVLLAQNVVVPSTGAWTSFTSVSVNTLKLQSGKHVLCIKSNGNFNLGNMTFSKVTSSIGNARVNDIRIFPNPVKDYIQVAMVKQSGASFEVFSIDGKLQNIQVIPNQNLSYKINFFNTRTGMYFLKVTSENNVSLFKFIKI